MSTLAFNRTFVEFGPDVRSFERSDRILEILWTEFPTGAGWSNYLPSDIMTSRVSSEYLKDGEPKLTPNLDLLFRAAGLVDIILRDPDAEPAYAGFVIGQTIVVSDRVVNGYRVLVGQDGAFEQSYVFDPIQKWFLPEGQTAKMAKTQGTAVKSRKAA